MYRHRPNVFHDLLDVRSTDSSAHDDARIGFEAQLLDAAARRQIARGYSMVARKYLTNITPS
jgi:hypothetical protein